MSAAPAAVVANFSQVARPPGSPSYSDTGLSTATTSYSYRVRATDAAANLSGYSSVVTAAPMTGTSTYNYDSNKRLSTVTGPGGRTVTYTYDAAGNVTSIQTTP